MNLHHRPLFVLLIAQVLGILFAGVFHLPHANLCIILSCGLLSFCILCTDTRSRLTAVLLTGVFLLAFYQATEFMRKPMDDVSKYATGKRIRISGIVVTDPQAGENQVSFILNAEKMKSYDGESKTHGKVTVTIRSMSHSEPMYVPVYGEKLEIFGRMTDLHRPDGSRFFADDMARQGVYCRINGYDRDVIHLDRKGNLLTSAAATVRRKLIDTANSMFPSAYAQLFIGILLGGYAGLPLYIQSCFMRTGTMHLLAASGYNCGIVAAIFGFLMWKLTIPRSWRHAILIFVIWGFISVAGGGPSLVRAGVMSTVFLSGYLVRRPTDLLNTIFAAAIILLFANPLNLFEIGFQLSFAAVTGIILSMPIVELYLRRFTGKSATNKQGKANRAVSWIVETSIGAVTVSVVAAVWTSPISAYYFNYLSIVSVLGNAATAVLVVALTAFGIVALSVACILPKLGIIAAAPAKACMWLMLEILGRLSEQTWSIVSVPTPPITLVVLYYLFVFGVLEYVYRRYIKASANNLHGSRSDRAGTGLQSGTAK